MTPVAKFFADLKEKLFGRYYEGPAAPQRLRFMVVEFANHTRATKEDWVEFATKLAEEAYRTGYQRGFEHAERDPEPYRDDLPPDVVADMLDPDWKSVERGIHLREACALVPDEPETEEQILRRQSEEVFLFTARRRR